MKPMDTQLKIQIQMAIKNEQDISSLIDGVDIDGMDLQCAKIRYLDVQSRHLQNVNFAHATIGESEKSVYLNNAVLENCIFIGTYFPGTVMLRHAQITACNFTGAYFPYADYRYAIFTRCTWCDAVFRIGTINSMGAIFDEAFFGDLTRMWGIKIVRKSTEEQEDDKRRFNQEA